MEEQIKSILLELNYELLEIIQKNVNNKSVFLIRIDRIDEQPVKVSDIEKTNKALAGFLEENSPFKSEYILQIESPGANRPLLTKRHFERMIGLKAKIKSVKGSFTASILKVVDDLVYFDNNASIKIGEMQANLAEFPDKHR